jgi:hypothetical protein
MRSIKDIKKEKGYVEFNIPDELKTRVIIMSIYSFKEVAKGIRIETKQHELVRTLHRMSNFYDETNYLLNGEKIEYRIIIFKKINKKFEFNEKNKGFITDLVIGKNIYRFTLTK